MRTAQIGPDLRLRQLTTTKTSHEEWTQIFQSLSWLFQFTYLFLSTISKFIKRKKILSLLVYVLHKTWNEVSSRGSRAVTAKKYTRKRDARAKLLFCSVKLLLFLLSRRRFILNFLLFTIHCDPSETELSQCNWIAPTESSRNGFCLIGSSFISG